MSQNLQAVVVGGGPAGLMAAEVLAQGGAIVDLYDAMPGVGRKFLVAGVGGLNLTHSEPLERFLSRYQSRRSQLEPLLRAFGPEQLRAWFAALGFETFIGTSGRVFPREMKAGPILHAWTQRLRGLGVRFHTRHHWLGWDVSGTLRFKTPQGEVHSMAKATVLALGGASWPQLGSTGAWVSFLEERGVTVKRLRPANCGFETGWSTGFAERFAGQPVKTVLLKFQPAQGEVLSQRGEFVISRYGVEGSLVYALSAALRDEIEASGQALVHLDLAPDWTEARLEERLLRPRGKRTLASYLERSVGIAGVKMGLLRECLPPAELYDARRLAAGIKSLPLALLRPRPIEEAISSAGGVAFEDLDDQLMLHQLPGIFCAGEMIDWEAPTGGYLLTACFASGRAAGLGALTWIHRDSITKSHPT